MKAVLKFNLPEEQEAFENAMNASRNAGFIEEVGNEIFRPARKHGYSDPHIAKLLSKLDDLVEKHAKEDPEWPTDEYGPQDATNLISMLESLYYELKNE